MEINNIYFWTWNGFIMQHSAKSSGQAVSFSEDADAAR